jgi:hypothetical protein
LLGWESVEGDTLERAKRKAVLEHLAIHGVEGDEQDKDGKNKFGKQEFKAILRLKQRTSSINWSYSRRWFARQQY